MCYNQFRPALRRPAQPEFVLYHIFQKKSNKIASSNCTIFFPEISFFLCNLHNPLLWACPQLSPHMRPLLFGSPGPGAYARRAGRKSALQKFFLPIGRPARRVNFPIWPPLCYKLSLLPAKIFLLSPLKKLVQ